jgi:hypothetical protein
MISPLMDVGWGAVAWGNLSLGLLALALNAVATAAAAMMDSRRRRELGGGGDLPAPPLLSFVGTLRAAVCGDIRAPVAFPAFPVIGIRFVELWTSGSVLGAFAELSAAARSSSDADKASRYATGVLVMLGCVGVLAGWQAVLIHKVLPRTTFVDYQLQALRENPLAVPSWAPQWLLPVGSWRPPPVRHRLAQQFSAQVSAWAAMCRILLHFGLSCVSSLLTAASFVSPTACEVSCVLLAIIFFASAAFVARFALYRCLFDTPIAVAVFALLGVQCSLLAAKEPVPTWMLLLQTLLTIFRSTLRLIAGVIENNMEALTEFDDESNKGDRSHDIAKILFDYRDHIDVSLVQLPLAEAADSDEDVEEDPNRIVNPIDLVVVVAADVSTTAAFDDPILGPSAGMVKRSRPLRSTEKTDLELQFIRDEDGDHRSFFVEVEEMNECYCRDGDDDEPPPPPSTPPSEDDDEALDTERIHSSLLDRALEAAAEQHQDEP